MKSMPPTPQNNKASLKIIDKYNFVDIPTTN